MTMTKELLELLQSDIYTDAPEYADRVAKIRELITGTNTFATEEEIEEAREEYARHSSDNIEIDEGAQSSRADNGVWIQAWVWLQDSDLGTDGKPRGEKEGEKDTAPSLSDKEWLAMIAALKSKINSPVVAGDRRWVGHLRDIKQTILNGEQPSLNEDDWIEIYYALVDCDGEQALVEKIGPDATNMWA